MPAAVRLWTVLLTLWAVPVVFGQEVTPRPVDPLLDAVQLPKEPAIHPLLDPTPVLVECPPPDRERFRVAVDVGLPVGVRLQTRLFDSNFWAEAGVGAWVIVPFASACLRYDYTLLRRQRNLFAVRPGVSATLVGLYPTFGTGVDAEFIWQHRFNGLGTTELGARLGITAVFLNGSRHTRAGAFPAPVLAMTFGWQF
jgi:hypothetical protein